MAASNRRFERYAAALPVASKRRSTQDLYLTADVSRHGAFVCTQAPRAPRELIQATFTLPDGATVEAMCMVARVYPVADPGPLGPGMGLDFFALGKEDKDRWDAFVGNCRVLSRAGLSTTQAQGQPARPPPLPADALAPVVSPPSSWPPSPAPTMATPPVPVTKPAPSSPPQPAPLRRAAPRVAACFLVRLKDVEQLRAFYTRDISTGGAFVQTPMLRAVGDTVELVLVHPDSDEEFRLRGLVKRVVETPPEAQGLGVGFDGMSPEDHTALLAFMETGTDLLSPVKVGAAQTLTLLERAVELEPDNPRGHVALGAHLLEEMRDVKGALRSLLRGVELEPAYPEAHRRLHRAYVRARDNRRAASHLRVAIALETVAAASITEEGVKL